jgi:hypothetical protein
MTALSTPTVHHLGRRRGQIPAGGDRRRRQRADDKTRRPQAEEVSHRSEIAVFAEDERIFLAPTLLPQLGNRRGVERIRPAGSLASSSAVGN